MYNLIFPYCCIYIYIYTINTAIGLYKQRLCLGRTNIKIPRLPEPVRKTSRLSPSNFLSPVEGTATLVPRHFSSSLTLQLAGQLAGQTN